MNTILFQKYAAFFIAVIFLSCKDQKIEFVKEQQGPNIIYILADDLGYGDVNAFNEHGKIKTPYLDQLAKEGMIFTDAHSPSAVCTPTRYGIITGRYSWRSELKSGVLTGKSKALIPPDRTTVASLLKKSGYTTGFIGKWHLGWNWSLKDKANFDGEGWNFEDFNAVDFTQPVTQTPNDLGFDYAYGHSGSLDMAPYVYVLNGKVTAPVTHVTENTQKYSWWRKGPTAADFIHEEVTPNFFAKANQFIREYANKENPFFMYLALPSPHTPILPLKEWQGKSKLNPYGDFVMMIDHYVGTLLNTIESNGIAANTMVIFTSDNGCSPEADYELLASKGHHPNGNFRGHKADIFEGGHRVPFIVKWPNKIKKGTRSDVTISLTDFMATCADIVNVALNDDEAEDSFTLLPLFSDDAQTSYLRKATIHHSIDGSFAIRKNQYKLIFTPGSGGWSFPAPGKDDMTQLPKFQLYDLYKDPSEQLNLYFKFPKIVAELTSEMEAIIRNGRSTSGQNQTNAFEGDDTKVWKQLGAFAAHNRIVKNRLQPKEASELKTNDMN